MSNVINFAGWRDRRRADAEQARIDEARAERLELKTARVIDRVEAAYGHPIPSAAKALIAEKVEQIEAERAPKFMPAYCDPANERRGAKHDATRDLSRVDIAKRMRADIKALQLTKAYKISVRTESYAGGGSIDIRVMAVPEGFRYLSPKAASWRKQFPGLEHRCPMPWEECQSEDWRSLRDKLRAIHGAYNRDNSDSMTDYFDVRYYGDVELDYRLARELERAEIEASPGDVWHPSCADR
ncbi:MAG: hypothetical protein K2X76_01500 [Sphingomonas sp.]|nr:hypothetical protein [Sphingomonas sp.]